MAAKTSIIDESADDGVPADFWNEVLDSFDVMDEDFQEGSEEAKKAHEERARKKKEEEEEKVKRFNEAWNIGPAAEEERIVIRKAAEPDPVVEKPAEPEERAASPEDCTIIQEEPVVITIDEEAVKVSENSVVVIPAEGQPKDPRLKRLEESNARNASPSSPTQESNRSSFSEDPPQRYFQVDRNREREREEQLRKDREREDFERARNLLRARSPGTYLRKSMSDEEDDIGRRVPRRSERSRSRRRSRSRDRSSRSPSRRNRRSRSRSRPGRSRRPSKSRSRSRSRSRRAEASSSSTTRNGGAVSPTSMMAQMQAMMQMMSDPTKNPMLQMNPMMANPMMAMMMNPMMATMMAGTGRTQVVTEESAEKMDRKDELTAQVTRRFRSMVLFN